MIQRGVWNDGLTPWRDDQITGMARGICYVFVIDDMIEAALMAAEIAAEASAAEGAAAAAATAATAGTAALEGGATAALSGAIDSGAAGALAGAADGATAGTVAGEIAGAALPAATATAEALPSVGVLGELAAATPAGQVISEALPAIAGSSVADGIGASTAATGGTAAGATGGTAVGQAATDAATTATQPSWWSALNPFSPAEPEIPFNASTQAASSGLSNNLISGTAGQNIATPASGVSITPGSAAGSTPTWLKMAGGSMLAQQALTPHGPQNTQTLKPVTPPRPSPAAQQTFLRPAVAMRRVLPRIGG